MDSFCFADKTSILIGGDIMVKGYNVHSGYMGWVEKLKKYILFSCELDYIEYLIDEEES